MQICLKPGIYIIEVNYTSPSVKYHSRCCMKKVLFIYKIYTNFSCICLYSVDVSQYFKSRFRIIHLKHKRTAAYAAYLYTTQHNNAILAQISHISHLLEHNLWVHVSAMPPIHILCSNLHKPQILKVQIQEDMLSVPSQWEETGMDTILFCWDSGCNPFLEKSKWIRTSDKQREIHITRVRPILVQPLPILICHPSDDFFEYLE